MATPIADTFSVIGGDLSLQIGLALGNELHAAARENNIDSVELTTMLLFGCILTAYTSYLADRAANVTKVDSVKFVASSLRTANRILLNLTLSVVARLAVSTHVLRTLRMLSLSSMATFFVFFASAASVGTGC